MWLRTKSVDSHRFHRNSLVKQFQRLFVVDAEAAAEPGAIRREAVEDFDARVAQPFAQGTYVRAEMGEVLSDGERAFGADKKARRLSLRLFHPEHLGQGHGLIVAL